MSTSAEKWAFQRKVQKEIERQLNSREYKEERRRMRNRDCCASMTKFLYIGIEWMELNYGCKRQGLLRFLNFFIGRMREIGRDDDIEYFSEAENRLKELYGISVMDMMGIRVTEEGELEFNED